MQSSCSWVLQLVSAGMTDEFVELGAVSTDSGTDSALDSDLADIGMQTNLRAAANQAVRGIPIMSYTMVYGA